MKDQPWSVGMRLVLVNAGEVDMSLAHCKSSLVLALITQTLARTVMGAGKHPHRVQQSLVMWELV